MKPAPHNHVLLRRPVVRLAGGSAPRRGDPRSSAADAAADDDGVPVVVVAAALLHWSQSGAASRRLRCPRAAAWQRLQRTTAVRIAAIGCCASQAAYQRTVRDTSLYLLEQ